MSSVFIQQQAFGYRWFFCQEQQANSVYQGDLQQLAEFYQAHSQVKQWVLVISALHTALRRLPFQAKERRHVLKALPFLLEDELLSDADQLHVIHGKLDKDSVDVLAIDKSLLSETLALFEQHHIQLSHCIAEYQLLAEANDELTLLYQNGYFIVQRPEQTALAFDAEHLALSLDIASDHFSHLPSSIALLVESEDDKAQALAYIPSTLQHLVYSTVIDTQTIWQQQFQQNAPVWNLLQGQFARAQQWWLMLKPWRFVAALGVLALLLHSVLLWADYRQQKQQYEALRSDMDGVFRQAFPQGQIVDYEKQLSRLLHSLEGGGNQQAFVLKLAQVGAVLAAHQIKTLNALNYNRSKNELRLDLLVDSYDQLQTVINALEQLKLTVDIQNSNAQGEQLRARLRITG